MTPTLNQAYAMIVEDEIQQLACVAITSDKTDPIAMQVHKIFSKTTHGSQVYKGKKCDYCHLSGHTRDAFCKLIGYPADWKYMKKGNYSGNSRESYQSFTNNQSHGRFDRYGHQAAGQSNNQFSAHNFTGSQSGEDTGLAVSSSSQGSKDINNAMIAKAQGFSDEEYVQTNHVITK